MDLKLKIIDFLWKKIDKAFTINEISKNLGQTYSNVNRIVTILIKEKVLDKKVIGHSFQCSINKNSDKAKVLIYLSEIEKREEYFKKYEKIALLFDDLLKELSDNIICVAIFGSYVKETFTKESDIDLLILLKKKEDLIPILRKISSLHNKEINTLLFTLKEFNQRKKETVIKEIFNNHLIIKGSEVFIKEVFEWTL